MKVLKMDEGVIRIIPNNDVKEEIRISLGKYGMVVNHMKFQKVK